MQYFQSFLFFTILPKNNDDGASKRLTRSSLKEHDAANEARGAEPPRTESEKGGSESSFGGKEKKPRTSKSMVPSYHYIIPSNVYTTF